MVDSRIKVAYILTPITFGGSEKVSLNFLRTVDRRRFEIQPILLTRPWEEELYFAHEIQRLGYVYDSVPVAIKTGGDPIRVLRVAKRLYTILKQGDFDLVHTHGYFADICGLPIAKLLGINSISTCHGFISINRTLKTYNLLDKYALRFCKRIIAVSDLIKDELIGSGVGQSRIEVLQNSVSTSFEKMQLVSLRQKRQEALCIEQYEFVIGYLGRLSEEKGLKYLIEAAAILHVENISFKLIIVGDGPEKTKLEQLAKDRMLEKIITFTGFQKNIEDWLPVFDVFVLPSLTEGTPMALLEAMAMRVPVIASSVGGVPEVVTDGINGFLVNPGDYEEICARIKSIKYDQKNKDTLIDNGYDTIKNKFNINKWCKKIESIYLNIMN